MIQCIFRLHRLNAIQWDSMNSFSNLRLDINSCNQKFNILGVYSKNGSLIDSIIFIVKYYTYSIVIKNIFLIIYYEYLIVK